MVGLLPVLPAVTVPRQATELGAALGKHFARFLASSGVTDESLRIRGSIVDATGGSAMILSLLPPVRLDRVLREVLSEDAFLSPYGLRALSRRHLDRAVPGRDRGLHGVHRLRARASRPPTCSAATRTGAGRSGSRSTTCSSSRCSAGTRPLGRRSPSSIRPARGAGFGCATWPRTCRPGSSRSGCPDADGHRPVAGAIAKFRDDPEWRDLLLFHEYFHGETGAGIGASHQTGWTGLVAHLLCRGGPLDRSPEDVAEPETVAAGS